MHFLYKFFERLKPGAGAERLLFGILLLLLLWPVWANKYFLTLDGPCHLYNSYVLLQFWKGLDVNFFSQYYKLNPHIDPNWFGHLLLASLMEFVRPLLAEKILITLFVTGYCVFSAMLIKVINKENSFLVFMPMIFVYSHVLQMGFYNFSFGLMWMVLLWWFFLKYGKSLSPLILVPVGAVILLLTYLSHPIGYLVGVCTLGLVYLLQIFDGQATIQERLKATVKQELLLVTAMLPSLVMLAYFFMRRTSGLRKGNDTLGDLFWGISHFTAIINLTYLEAPFVISVFYLLIVLLVVTLVRKFSKFNVSGYDAFLVAFTALMVFYFNCPGAIGGAGIVPERIQVIPFAVLPFWLASASFPPWMKPLVTWFMVFVIVALMVVRIPVHARCSDAIEEYMSASGFIAAHSTVLPLSYAHGGKDVDGKEITTANWTFVHACDYMGTNKSLIMLGNYEGNTGYFPLIWRDTINPFWYIGSIENVPPCLDLNGYTASSGVKVDYVVTECLDSQFIHHPCTIKLMGVLDSAYTKIYTSAHGRVMLYKRKDLP